MFELNLDSWVLDVNQNFKIQLAEPLIKLLVTPEQPQTMIWQHNLSKIRLLLEKQNSETWFIDTPNQNTYFCMILA